MDRPADPFPPPASPEQIAEALIAAEVLDATLRRCAMCAAMQFELASTLAAASLRDWAQRPVGER